MTNPIIHRVAAAQGNSLMADELIRDYLPFIHSEVAKFCPDGTSGDELSIAMIAFHEAIESYCADRGSFLSFASLVMRSRMIDYQRSEARHYAMSLQTPLGDGSITMEDTLEDPTDSIGDLEDREATASEIEELTAQLARFGLSLTDIADQSPKQDRTKEACQTIIQHARDHPDIIRGLLKTKKLPIRKLVKETGISKKIMERHRKYLMAVMIIYANGYELIRNHIGMTFIKEGERRQ